MSTRNKPFSRSDDLISKSMPGATKVLTSIAALALLGVWVSPISTYADQSDLIVSVADPGIQFYEDSGLTTDAPVLVETFENTQFGNYVCTQESEGWWGGTYCSDGYWDNEQTLYSTDDMVFESPVGVFTRAPWNGDVFPADKWGGAGGEGQYAGAGDILLTISDESNYRYLGFWWSAGSIGNDVQLLDIEDNLLATFTVDGAGSEDLEGVTSNEAYRNNPNTDVWGWETGEKYAFVHLRYPPGFRKVRFVSSGNGFEFDNVTISTEVPDFSDSETTTETFNPYALGVPEVLIADPRTGEIRFPGVSLGAGENEVNAMLCVSEVQDEVGNALTSARSIEISDSGGTLTVAGDTNLRTFAGSRANVVSLSSGLILTPSNSAQTFGVVGSRYIRVTATPQTNAGTAGCTGNATDSQIIEIRFVNMIQRNSFGIQLD